MNLWNNGIFAYQPRQANNFFAGIAAKRFKTKTEEEIKQLLRDKSSKSTNKVFNKVLTFVILINIYDLWHILYAYYWDL